MLYLQQIRLIAGGVGVIIGCKDYGTKALRNAVLIIHFKTEVCVRIVALTQPELFPKHVF